MNCLIGGCLGLITACFMGPEIFFAAIALISVGVVIGYNVTRLSDDQIKTKINNPCIEQSQLLANTTSK
ncbi:MAG: hypothetical protein KTV77_01220 [Wolbachia endosymbiont of Fragariocoptes setiger]|nr:hypothetical protein [Wolbachia endosymbiont of Fragariocoptes setiger]